MMLNQWLNNVLTNDPNILHIPSSAQVTDDAQDNTFSLKGSTTSTFLFFMTS